MFIDEAEIYVLAGDGGHGSVSFRREKFIPRGGPDGGDGGRGGSVYLVATDKVDTLLDFAGRHHWRAGRGGNGSGANRTGKNGEDLEVQVPAGTIVYDIDRDVCLKDLTTPGQRIRVARGGRGGHGNARFATATEQAPRFAEDGKAGEERRLKLELKLIADVGLVGLPNAGKSTLLSRCSAARPKVAPYPFTTLSPNLGIVELAGFRRFVMADIPGLIEGSHLGHGLGHDFLKHIERTRILVHLVDISGFGDGADPIDNYRTIRHELEKYSPLLASKREIVVASKTDLDSEGAKVRSLEKALGRKLPAISAVTGAGVGELLELLWREVESARQEETPTIHRPTPTPRPTPPHLLPGAESQAGEYS